jgi:hypothetical protein
VVLRARKDTGDLAWGGLVAARRYAGERGDNTVMGPDVGWQINDQWRLRAQWLHARTTAQLDARGAELARGPEQDGDRWRLRVMRQTGAGETSFGVDDIGTGFRHDTGFVNQAGIRRLEAFQSWGWQALGPFNEFYVNVDAYQVRDRTSGAVVQEVLRPGIWFTAASNVEGSFNFLDHALMRTEATAPLLAERYLNANLTITPATWVPLLNTSLDLGRLADTAARPQGLGAPAGEVRPGGRFSLSARLRPLRALELEPSLNTAWLRRDGGITYRESVQQWLAVWHFNAQHNLRAIVQRSLLDRRSEPGVSGFGFTSRTDSLTYAFRHTAGTRLYVGATRSRANVLQAPSHTEAFVKLEVDADDLRALRQPHP